jgi:hypothetical protein
MRHTLPLLLASVALAVASTTVHADDDDDFPPPPVGTPVAPKLPAKGVFAEARVGAAAFRGCAAYGVNDIWASDVTEVPRVAVCNDDLYVKDNARFSTTDPGVRMGARVGRPQNFGDVKASFDGSANGWKQAGGAGAVAQANLLPKNFLGNPNPQLNLKVGAQAINSRDVAFGIQKTLDPWTLEHTGWTSSGSGPTWWVEGGVHSAGSGAVARLADSFVAVGSGKLSLTFSVDGLYERGGGIAEKMPSGGRVSFAAVLLDPLGLQAFNLGGDLGTVNIWKPGSIDSVGFALGRDRRDDLFGHSPFPDGETLLGSRDLRGFAPQGSEIASENLPASPSFTERTMTLELDVENGKTYWLLAGLAVSASGWNPCDTTPGSDLGLGDNFTCNSSEDRTELDFTGTAKLSAVLFGSGLTGLQTASGVDYVAAAAAATAPIPESGTYALMALGLAGIGLAARRRQGQPRTPAPGH